MGIIEKIKANPKMKKRVHWLIASTYRARPRWYIRLIVNRFYHNRGKHALIRWSARIDVFFFKKFDLGNYSTIEDYCVVNNGAGDVIIGDHCRVGIGSVVLGPVTMKNGSGLGQHVFIGGFNHGYKDATKNSKYQSLDVRGVTIEEEAHVGANSVVLAGVTVGMRAQVGAGSVVTKDVPAYSIAAGNPCKVIKMFNHNTSEWERV